MSDNTPQKWRAISRKTTPADERPGIAHYLENPRLTVEGELRFRRGFAKSQFATAAGAILAIIPASPAGNQYVGFLVDGGSIEGGAGLPGWWGDVEPEAPTGTATQQSTGSADDSIDRAYTGGSAFTDSFFLNGGDVTERTFATAIPINTDGVNGETYRLDFTIDLEFDLDGLDGGGELAEVDFTYRKLTPVADVLSDAPFQSVTVTPLEVITLTNNQFASFTGEDFLPINTITMVGTFTMYAYGGTYELVYTPFVLTSSPAEVTVTAEIAIDVTRITGGIAPSALWDLVITRQSQQWEDTYAIYARDGAYPIDENDPNATFIANVTILPPQTAVNYTATVANTNATWKFVAIPKRNGVFGPPGRIT